MQLHWEHRLRALAGDTPHPDSAPIISYWADDFGLQRAYQLCASITRRASKSFYLASSLLPEPKRNAVRTLYAFCRTVDDIVDEPGTSDRRARLDEWRGISTSGIAPAGNLVAEAWVDALRRYHIPRQYAVQLIDGVARDLDGHRYETFDDLSTYCYGVASTVGLMAMYVVGFRSTDAVPYAIKLGVALQMTNILRDVGEDYRRRRLYLPRQDMRRFGVDEATIAAGRPTDRWREFMRFEIARTRQLYDEAWPGIALLDADGRLAIGAAAELYRGILAAIEKNDYDVFNRRASLGAWAKLVRIPPLLTRLRLAAWLTVPDDRRYGSV
jgi:phytoene synthase